MEDDLGSSAKADDHLNEDAVEERNSEEDAESTNLNESTGDAEFEVDSSATAADAVPSDHSTEHDGDRSALPLCPYCGSSVESDPVDCPACSTTYHFDCASEAGGCIQPGCSSSVLAPTEPPPPPPAVSPTGDAPPSTSAAETTRPRSLKDRKATRFLVPIAALLIGLLLGGLAIKTNVAAALVGKSYSKSEVTTAREDGYSSGREAGYSSGRTAGIAEGKTAGCKAVFSALGTTRVMDFYDWYLVYRVPTSLYSSSC